jgi:tetratricopeptide (TPR) repeat protein
MTGRKIVLSVLLVLFTSPLAFCQSEVLKGVVNSLAYYKQRNEIRFLGNAKKSIDSLLSIGKDSTNLQKNVYSALINSTILYIDSLNKLNQPTDFLRKTTALVDRLSARSKIFQYDAEMNFAKQCLANVYIRRGFTYVRNSDFANAQALFLRARKYAPDFKQLNAYIAYTNNRMGNLQASAKYYDTLIDNTDSTKVEYLETASNIYKTIGDTSRALELIKRGRKLAPNDKNLLLAEANIYSNQKSYKLLEPLLPTLLDINANNPDIVFVAANCYDQLYEYDKAESLYLHAIDLNSSAYDPVFNLGLLYLKKSTLKKGDKEKNITSATLWLEKANEISPDDIKCLEILKMVYTQTNNKYQLDKLNNKLKQLTNQ